MVKEPRDDPGGGEEEPTAPVTAHDWIRISGAGAARSAIDEQPDDGGVQHGHHGGLLAS